MWRRKTKGPLHVPLRLCICDITLYAEQYQIGNVADVRTKRMEGSSGGGGRNRLAIIFVRRVAGLRTAKMGV